MSFNGKYEIIRVINQGGAYGTLFEVKDKSNVHYALKLIKNNLSAEYETEIQVLKNKNIKSKYIIELKDDFYDEKNDVYCIVMELCDGDLRDVLKNINQKDYH